MQSVDVRVEYSAVVVILSCELTGQYFIALKNHTLDEIAAKPAVQIEVAGIHLPVEHNGAVGEPGIHRV